jgi:hypothetical protein
MKYRDIAMDRFQLPSTHPILATLSIDPADWHRLQELDTDNPATRLLGYDEPHDERLTVYVPALRAKCADAWKMGGVDECLFLLDAPHAHGGATTRPGDYLLLTASQVEG